MPKTSSLVRPGLAALLILAPLTGATADSRAPAPIAPPPSYADLADLADGTPLIVRAQPRKLVAVEPARAQGVRAGWGRFYIEARTEAVIFGATGLGQQLRYLVDLPLDAKGKPPAIKKKSVVIFARTVPGRPGELQLVARDAQLLWDPSLDARLRGVVGELNAPDAPRRVSGVREVIFVPGNLAGESETQIFLATSDGEPAAITVSRNPGQPPRWSVSFSEVVGDAANAPVRDTLTWYRLACFLPPVLPGQANTSGTQADRAAAGIDYRFVLDQLGPCARTRR
ncbi:hypothetical protein [Novosphingobium sp.]|uniref:hypothetical protein n=1 Tax=Novosphingobium sp. TaxID=1874826 RepID=UPI0035B44AA8